MSQEKFYIPKHLDDMSKFLLWEIDEALAFIIPLFLGFMMGKGLFGLVAAFLCFHFWKKVKGAGGKNLIRSLIYWHYPKSILGLKATPDSSIRNFIG
jgi:conjugal transfer pilus assembly protein TraL